MGQSHNRLLVVLTSKRALLLAHSSHKKLKKLLAQNCRCLKTRYVVKRLQVVNENYSSGTSIRMEKNLLRIWKNVIDFGTLQKAMTRIMEILCCLKKRTLLSLEHSLTLIFPKVKLAGSPTKDRSNILKLFLWEWTTCFWHEYLEYRQVTFFVFEKKEAWTIFRPLTVRPVPPCLIKIFYKHKKISLFP